MSSRKVSIVVPIYNAENYLERCLGSLVTQTFQEIEILCVNDGSTDRSQAIIDEFAQDYPDLVVSLSKENGGVADARNYGLKYARAEYITFMDNDDWVDADWIEKLYATTREMSADLVIGDITIAGDNNKTKVIQAGYTSKKNLLLQRHEVWNKLFKTSLFRDNDISFPVGIWCDDLATTPKLIATAQKIAHVNGPCYYYCQRINAQSRNLTGDRLNDHITAVENLYEYFDRENLLPDYKDELEFIFIRELIVYYLFAYAHTKNLKSMLEKLNDLEKLVRNKFPDFKQNEYLNNKSVLDRNYFISLRCYLAHRLLYVIVVKLRAMIKILLLSVKGRHMEQGSLKES